MEWGTRTLESCLSFYDSGVWGNEGTSDDIPVLRSTNIRNWQLDVQNEIAFRIVSQRDINRCKLEYGDIIVTKSSGSPHLIGESASFNIRTDKIFLFSNFLLRLRPNQSVIDPSYLFNYLKSPNARRVISDMQRTTSGLRNLQIGPYKNQVIPIPFPQDQERSLIIQRKIVARIEALLSEVQEAVKLNKIILEDSSNLYLSTVEDILSNFPLRKFSPFVESYKNGIYKKKEFYGRGYRSARMFNIRDGVVELHDAPLLDVTSEELVTYGLIEGDILINRVNSRELVGKAAIVLPGTPPCTFESKNIRVRIKRDEALPEYIAVALNSRTVKQQLLAKQKPAIGQATINQTDLDNLEIPSPPKKEQERIVHYLKGIKDQVKELLTDQKETNDLLILMEQAILAEAFCGEL
jgi:restriction endonuclease S subunit